MTYLPTYLSTYLPIYLPKYLPPVLADNNTSNDNDPLVPVMTTRTSPSPSNNRTSQPRQTLQQVKRQATREREARGAISLL